MYVTEALQQYKVFNESSKTFHETRGNVRAYQKLAEIEGRTRNSSRVTADKDFRSLFNPFICRSRTLFLFEESFYILEVPNLLFSRRLV